MKDSNAYIQLGYLEQPENVKLQVIIKTYGFYKEYLIFKILHTCQNISVYNLLDYFKLDLQEKEICLKEEGIPDVCLSFFKTGTGHETCNRWMEANRAKIKRSEAKLKKCVKPSTSQL